MIGVSFPFGVFFLSIDISILVYKTVYKKTVFGSRNQDFGQGSGAVKPYVVETEAGASKNSLKSAL